MTKITFFVPGLPATAGSKTCMNHPVTNVKFYKDSCKRGPQWRKDVQRCFRGAYKGAPLEGPVSFNLIFRMPRPKTHYRSGKHSSNILKPNAPQYPISKPDTTKMVRALEDALTTHKKRGVILWSGAWLDDSQVVTQHNWKLYADEQHPVGAYVTIRGDGIEE